jgi:hypothetical protein
LTIVAVAAVFGLVLVDTNIPVCFVWVGKLYTAVCNDDGLKNVILLFV